jgi:hypothetical protein
MLTLLTTLAISTPAEATTMVPLSIEQIVDISTTIVRGTVTEVWTEPDEKTGTIWTHAQVEVEQVFKGTTSTSVIIIEQPGGVWGEVQTSVESVARFSVGEDGYFFVEELSNGRMVSSGMFQGKFNIIMDPYSRTELALRFPVHGNRTFDHRFIPLPPEHARISIDQFEDRIEERIENGWDGKSIPGISNEKLQRINQKPTETQP